MRTPDAIGGYFGLELPKASAGASTGTAYSTIRAALQDLLIRLLQKKQFSRIWYPSFICPSVLQSIAPLLRDYVIVNYHINELLSPPDLTPEPDDLVYYYSPFGLTEAPLWDGIVVDNAHALFKPHLTNQHTLYSPRKFLGIPDGAILQSDLSLPEPLPLKLTSHASYLIERLDQGAEAGFQNFQSWERSLFTGSIEGMSTFSRALLNTVNLSEVQLSRVSNFNTIHSALAMFNELSPTIDKALKTHHFVPYSYPFLCARGGQIRKTLISSRIYTPLLWSDMPNANSFEFHLAQNCVNLPVDQRYTSTDMNVIVKSVLAVV